MTKQCVLVVPLLFCFSLISIFSYERVLNLLLNPDVPEFNNVRGGNSSSSSSSSCESMLDKFDDQFNQRRIARQRKVVQVEKSVASSTAAAATTNNNNEQQQQDELLLGEEEKEQQKLIFFDLYEAEATCFTDERFGSLDLIRYSAFGDGPKFICGADYIISSSSSLSLSSPPSSSSSAADRKKCLVYSVGSNNDIAFELTVDKLLGCEIHTFDPTLTEEEFVGHNVTNFHPWGLGIDGKIIANFSSKFGGNGEQSWTSKGIKTIVKELGHTDRTINILKIDCEGCEWETIPILMKDITAGNIKKVDQIQIEMHQWGGDGDDGTRNITQFFQSLDLAGYRIFHKERNHWGCSGYGCVEYAFASEEFLRNANKAAVCY